MDVHMSPIRMPWDSPNVILRRKSPAPDPNRILTHEEKLRKRIKGDLKVWENYVVPTHLPGVPNVQKSNAASALKGHNVDSRAHSPKTSVSTTKNTNTRVGKNTAGTQYTTFDSDSDGTEASFDFSTAPLMVDEPPHPASTSRAAANAATSRNPNTNPHSPPQVEVDEVPTIPTTRNGRTRTRTKTDSSEGTVRPPPPTSKGRNRNKTAAGEMETVRPPISSPSKKKGEKEGKSKRKRGLTPVEVVEAGDSDGNGESTEKRRKAKGKNRTSKEDTTLAKEMPSKTAKSKRKVVEEEEDEGDVEEQPRKGTRKKQLRKQDEDVDVKEDLHSIEKTKRKGKVREKEPEMPVEISVKKSRKEKKALEEEEENEQVDRELRKKGKKVSPASEDKETGSKRKRTKGAAGEEEDGPTKRVKRSKLQSDGTEEENMDHKEKAIPTISAPEPANSKEAANKRKRKIADVGVEVEFEPPHSPPPVPAQQIRNAKRKTRNAPSDEEDRADESPPKKVKRSKVGCSPPSEEVSDIDEEKRLQRQKNVPKTQQVPPVQRAAKKKKNGKGSESKVVEVESQPAMAKGKKRKEVEDLPKSNSKSKRSKSGLVSDNELETEMAIEEEGSPSLTPPH
ncbi:hypothetical protein BT69DRAFT_1343848 [Atractiella rhizophila]|nr:hypothetical protein BT69DRAFT_1343848 [Atractiella rhizophila]